MTASMSFLAESALPYAGGDPTLPMYRQRTEALLRRYLRLSVEAGRLPSLLGREFFRTRVTSYHACTFEDVIIFVHDMERSLEKLGEFDRQLVAKLVFQEYSQEEAARLLGCGRRTLSRRYPEVLDQLSEIFLEGNLLHRMTGAEPACPEFCQGGETEEIPATDSEQEQ